MLKPVASILFNLLEQYGVRHIVCSPGSRNAALLQLADRLKHVNKHVVVDERTAAFIGLGISISSRTPVVLICTSGSALLNYASAVAEAFYQGIPLIIISADRPQEWIDQDDSQTIRQPGTLSSIVKASYDLRGDETASDYLWYTERIVNEGLIRALDMKPGPVHFNIHLDGAPIDSFRNDLFPKKVCLVRPTQRLENAVMKEFASYACDKKILVTVGFMQPDNKLQNAMLAFSRLPNVCIMAETISNLHLPLSCYKIDTALFPLSSKEEKAYTPDVLISLGGALISRRLKEFIRRNPPVQNWTLSYSDNLIDCFQALTVKIASDSASFMQTLGKMMHRYRKEKGNNTADLYRESWEILRNKHSKSISKLPWCDLKALKIVLDHIPEEANLFLSNGTSVRYGQIIPSRPTHATYSNRGVSGIEGCTSTALGASLVYGGVTCLITGDMSFSYDLGALGSGLADHRLKVIVLDNGGGDIFRFIKATKELEIREHYLCADPQIPVEMLAATYNWAYFHASDEYTLKNELEEFFLDGLRPAVLHIDTRKGCSNSEILTDFLIDSK